MSLFDALYQTAWTLWRQRNARCSHCAAHGRKATLRSVVTARGYVLRCWQCGCEYVEHGRGEFRQVWPIHG